MTTTISMVAGSQRRAPPGSKYPLQFVRQSGSDLHVLGAGKLLPGIQAKVIKSDGTTARYGERGELVVRGPNSTLGYFHNPKA